MDNSFYLKNGSVLWNGAFTPLDMAVEDGHITALSRGHHNEKGLPEVDVYKRQGRLRDSRQQ